LQPRALSKESSPQRGCSANLTNLSVFNSEFRIILMWLRLRDGFGSGSFTMAYSISCKTLSFNILMGLRPWLQQCWFLIGIAEIRLRFPVISESITSSDLPGIGLGNCCQGAREADGDRERNIILSIRSCYYWSNSRQYSNMKELVLTCIEKKKCHITAWAKSHEY
jgi:hypothetical protein